MDRPRIRHRGSRGHWKTGGACTSCQHARPACAHAHARTPKRANASSSANAVPRWPSSHARAKPSEPGLRSSAAYAIAHAEASKRIHTSSTTCAYEPPFFCIYCPRTIRIVRSTANAYTTRPCAAAKPDPAAFPDSPEHPFSSTASAACEIC